MLRQRPARRRWPRRALVLVPAVLASLFLAVPAWAHATLEGSTPGVGQTVRTVPASVTLRFDEAVSTLPTSLQVYGPAGDRIDDGNVTHPDGVATRVSVGLTGSDRGTYLVSWRVISADSHPATGAFTFNVGKQTRAPAVATAQTDRTVAVALGALRWAGYLGAALLVGIVGFVLLCWRQGWRVRRTRVLAWSGIGLVAVGAAGSILVKGPYDAALALGSVGRSGLIDEVVATTYGHAMLARLALVLLAGLLIALARLIAPPLRAASAGMVGIGVLVTYALTGHAVVDPWPVASATITTIHVAAMALWLGGLAALFLIVLRDPKESTSDAAADTVAVTQRFSRVATGAVVALVSTGVYQSWREVGAWAAFVETTYGRELLIKLGLVAAVLGAAGYSRSWAREHRGSGVRALRRSVALEAVGVLAVLAITATLVVTEPARTAYHPSVTTSLRLGPDTVLVDATPRGDRQMQLHLYVTTRHSRPVEPPQVRAAATLPASGGQAEIGPLSFKLVHDAAGHYSGTLDLPVTGRWQLAVTVRTSAIDEYTKGVPLTVR